MAFADLPQSLDSPRRYLAPRIFDRVCIENDIQYRLTKPSPLDRDPSIFKISPRHSILEPHT